jgi:single-strand DNA-binding protein
VAGSINRVVIVGNLTRDPEMRTTPSGLSVCNMRIAVNDRVKDQNTGEWGDRANYFDVDVFGGQGERCAQWLAKGRQVAIEGRLRWREWESQEGQKRQAVSIVADNVQFIGPREGGGQAPGQGGGFGRAAGPAADTGGLDEPPRGDGPDDDDIPF